MLEFTSTFTYEIKGRGTVYEVRAPFEFSDRKIFLGPAIIDGVEREVVDVESWALGTIAKGAPIGLLVR